MSAEMMRGKVTEIDAKIAKAYEKLQGHSNNNLEKIFRNESDFDDAFDLDSSVWPPASGEINLAINRSLRSIKRTIQLIASEINLIKNYKKQQNKYSVEVQKKYSIPFACIVFMLVGAPLGILAKKGGFAVGMSISLAFFIMYWTFLIAGENLADRGMVSPFWAMWSPNILIGSLGIYLSTRSVKKLGSWNADRITSQFRKIVKRDGVY